MGADPGQLHHQHPDRRGPLRDLVGDAEQLLDGEAVDGLLHHGREVVHPGAERDALRPVAELHVLLDAGVQVTDPGAGLGDRLAVELEDQAEHAVGRGVLWAHVDDDALLVQRRRLLDQVVPVAARRVEDAGVAGRIGVGAAGGVGVARAARLAWAGRAHAGSSQSIGAKRGVLATHRGGAEIVVGRTSWGSISCSSCAGRGAGWSRPCTRPGCHPGGSPCAAGGPASRPA